MAKILDKLYFKVGQVKGQEDTIIIPLLERQGLPHAISIGPKARNMAESFNFTKDDLIERQNVFLKKNNLSPLSQAYFSTVPEKNNATIETISIPNNTSHAIPLPADAVFTHLSSTPLIHKPADCPTAIIFAKKQALTVIGIAHIGRPQVNNQVTEQTIEYLTTFYDFRPHDIFIGISPGIGPKNYFIKQKDQTEKNFVNLAYWGDFVREDLFYNEVVLRIDVLGKILSILEEKGIPDSNIEAYGDTIDTFELASQEPPLAFSHRYATSTNQPTLNGRIMVVAQLP